MLLDVIIIAKNEEYNIARCLDSIIKNISDIDFRIILSDSNSTDKTVSIARKYSVEILKIESNLYSAALGRQVGLQYSKSKYVMFLDADMELAEKWIEKAIDYLEKSENEIAGVTGIRSDKIYQENKFVKSKENVYKICKVQESSHFGGAGLFKTHALKDVGGYDIRMTSNEEPELHSRLTKKGYKVIELPYDMIIHHTEYISVSENIKSVFSVRNRGIGLGLKYSIEKKNFFQYVKRMYKHLIPLLVDLLMVIIVLFSLAIHKSISTIILIMFISQLFSLIVSKKFKSLVISKFLILPTIIGFTTKKVKVEYTVKQLK